MEDRPSFESHALKLSKSPEPNWKVGQGLNSHPQANLFHHQAKFKSIKPQETEVSAFDMYKIMITGIAPRPVALVGTINQEGVPNLAPISWYQMVSHDPPLVMISFGGPRISERKHSEVNVLESGEFTISASSEPFVEALNFASVDAPQDQSEFALAGLTPVSSNVVTAPYVGESPFAMECKVDFTKEYNNDQGQHTTTLVVARVVMIHVREDCIKDGGLDPSKSLLVTRFGGMLYSRSTEGFEIERPKFSNLTQREQSHKKVEVIERQSEILEKFP